MPKPRSYCPICYTEMEVIDVAPCDDCGWDVNELVHFAERIHTYAKFTVYGSEMVLCDFCDVDFSSYDPGYWGLTELKRVGYGTEGFRKLKEIPIEDLSISKGKFCSICKARSTFLEALKIVRDNTQK